MRARTIAAGLLIVLLVGGALVLALQEGFATRRTGTHLSARDGAPVSLRPVAGDEDAESDGESSTSDDSPVVSPSHGESANDEDARIRSVYRLPAEHLPGLTPLERRLALAAADAKERLPGSWYAFHDSISSLAVEAHLRCLRGELPKNGWWYVSRSNAWELDPFLESLFEMPLPQDHVRQILPLRGGRHALLMAYPRRIGILDAATSTAPRISSAAGGLRRGRRLDPIIFAPISRGFVTAG
ncbi:MAG: hypothetical protein HYV04_16460 [Deltaproteobacteria bacterium]|nr:hypothetical protein [Deltaproteobacteria bacterium]